MVCGKGFHSPKHVILSKYEPFCAVSKAISAIIFVYRSFEMHGAMDGKSEKLDTIWNP